MTARHRKYLPKPLRINQWGLNDIIYGCRHCSTPFTALGRNEHFCHCCGAEQDWSFMPDRISAESAVKYHEMSFGEQQLFMEKIDALCCDEKRRRMQNEANSA